MNITDDILVFWFGDADVTQDCDARAAWFKVDPEFDAEIDNRFAQHARAAADGAYDNWAETPPGSMALCILLDQFPRNLHRGNANAFATDAKARQIASAAIEKGHDQEIAPAKRSFLYLPFMHSENIEDQIRSVELYRALGNESNFRYALEHHYVISRFGRFPTRNAALGRETTPEEATFLQGFDAF
ncbi:MAG: DUF924 domain-containing protein [Rhodospirillaceae bacterium]|jgi:uncharacterized protein (DUF924 family)|nr:DUF924 domain-containing protein [Rhodospirillaceae bacterium]